MSITKKAILVVLLILVADQALKIFIKTTMPLGATHPVMGDWFLIRFIENRGMAFGWDIPGKIGKPILTIFRIIAAGVIVWYIRTLIIRNAAPGFILCVALIFAGAMGNIIDSVFYGVLFSDSTYFETARFLPDEGGYAPLLSGKVVDMFYFPLIEGNYPDWFPFLGGQKFIFFRPIFNIADTAISIGVVSILIFQRKYLKNLK
jgi:signal peptidase II